MDGKQEKPPFAESYGGAQETKMSAEQKDLQGPSQEEAQKIRDGVGLTPQEIQAINQPGQPRSRSRFKVPEQAVNVGAALGTTIGGGVGLVLLAQDALRNTPPAVVQEQKPDPKRDTPPAGVVFPESATADGSTGPSATSSGPSGSPQDAPVTDAPVEVPMNVVTTIYMPAMFKGVARPPYQAQEVKEPETPIYLREFGAPERGVVMKNKVEQGGGNLAYVEMGDQELWNNLMYLRETYGRPDLKLEITYYSSLELYSRDPNRPNYNPENERVIPWDAWAANPGIYKNGLRVFSYREADKTLEFRITLPETWPGKLPTEKSLNWLHQAFLLDMQKVFLFQENGRPTEAYRKPEYYKDFDAHPPVIVDSPATRVLNSAFWIKLE